jgi:uncharacterized protein with HEPN domain
MRRERLYLDDIVQACDDIAGFLEGFDLQAFLQDARTQGVILQRLMVIGEAASRLPDDFTEAHPEVDWPAIVGLRNRIVHAYFNIELPIIWEAATRESPHLRSQIKDILRADFGA